MLIRVSVPLQAAAARVLDIPIGGTTVKLAFSAGNKLQLTIKTTLKVCVSVCGGGEREREVVSVAVCLSKRDVSVPRRTPPRSSSPPSRRAPRS